jgi:hypothetical protein
MLLPSGSNELFAYLGYLLTYHKHQLAYPPRLLDYFHLTYLPPYAIHLPTMVTDLPTYLPIKATYLLQIPMYLFIFLPMLPITYLGYEPNYPTHLLTCLHALLTLVNKVGGYVC